MLMTQGSTGQVSNVCNNQFPVAGVGSGAADSSDVSLYPNQQANLIMLINFVLCWHKLCSEMRKALTTPPEFALRKMSRSTNYHNNHDKVIAQGKHNVGVIF